MRDHVLDPGKTVRGALFHQLHPGFRSKITVAQRDVIHDWPAFCIVALQSRDRIRTRYQRRGKHPRVDDGLGTRLRTNRLHRMSGISDERDATECPSRHRPDDQHLLALTSAFQPDARPPKPVAVRNGDDGGRAHRATVSILNWDVMLVCRSLWDSRAKPNRMLNVCSITL